MQNSVSNGSGCAAQSDANFGIRDQRTADDRESAEIRDISRNLKVGLCGIGLEAYWSQFDGLRERLEGYVSQVETQLRRPGVDIVNVGLVDSIKQSMDCGHRLRAADIDILVVYLTTYALSATILPVIRHTRVPVLVLNLQPESRIDYTAFNRLGSRKRMTGEWLAHCSSCPLPELANVFQRVGIDFHQVTGCLAAEDPCWREVDMWLDAARVWVQLAHSPLGLIGHYYSGMADIYTDLTRYSALFGTHVEVIEPDELSAIRADVSEETVTDRMEVFNEEFEIQKDCQREDLIEAAKTSVALDRLVERYGLGSLAYYHKGVGNENERTFESIILGASLITARGIPVAGEYEVKNVLAMKIMALLGIGGSFSEFYATDFDDDVVLLGHDGPGHVAIANGKTKVRPLEVYHGKVGRGLSVEMSVRHGPITLLSVGEDAASGFRFVVAEGESVPGPILQIGNTNSRYRFPIGARRFISEWSFAGPAHHCAVGVGHAAAVMEKLSKLFKIPLIRVC